MNTQFKFFQEEFFSSLKQATPIVLAQISFMLMGVVDTIMIGQLNPEALAGAGFARSIFWVFAVFAMGILSSVEAIAAQAFGGKQFKQIEKILFQSLKFCLYISLIITPIIVILGDNIHLFKAQSGFSDSARTYLMTVGWGTPFLLFFVVMQKYWQAQNVVRPILVFAVLGNAFNFFMNYLLIFGNWGFPQWGLYGAGIATNLSSAFLFLCLATLTYTQLKAKKVQNIIAKLNPLQFEKTFFKTALKLGLPAGSQQVFEVSLFSIATLFAAWLGTIETATHHVVVTIVSLAYTIPIGLSSAAAYRVGQLVGAGERSKAIVSGWATMTLGIIVMTFIAIALFVFPNAIMGIFTASDEVIEAGKQILFWAALFQVLDAIQGCATGSLRGFGNTKAAAIASAIGYYPIGLLLSALLCFHYSMGLNGLWIGLCSGVFSITVLILFAWIKETKQNNTRTITI